MQDAHEAIRPDDARPAARGRRRATCEPDELKLYRLIWNRFVASQMTPSVSDVTTVEIEARREGLARRRRRCAPPARCSRTPASSASTARSPTTEAHERAGGRGRGRRREGPPARARRGRRARAARGAGRGPRDAAAAALQRGLAREVHGGERHRPALHLRRHPAQDRAARVRAQEGPALHPDAARPPRRRPDEGGLRGLLPDRVHGPDGGGARRGRGGQGRLAPGPAPTSTASSRRTATARRRRCTR